MITAKLPQHPLQRQKLAFIWISLVPAMAIFMLFYLAPIFNTFIGSLFNWNALTGVMRFNGLTNYENAFADPLLFKSLGNTFELTFFAVLIKTVLAFLAAVTVNSVVRGRSFYRTVLFLPTICTMIATSFVFRFLFQPEAGTINGYLTALGLAGPGWLEDPRWALPAVIIYTCWKDFGFVFLIFLAGIQGISGDVLEASVIDGASGWKKMRYIVLPMLKPITIYNITTQVIGSLQIFTSIIALTNAPGSSTQVGGPMYATTTIGLYIYQNAFTSFKFGYASAISVILFAIILAFTALQLKFSRLNWGY